MRLFLPTSFYILTALAALWVPATSAQAWTLKTLHSFCVHRDCADGAYPMAVLADRPDRILGTTLEGGTQTYGTAFALRLGKDGATWKRRTIFDFCNCADGGTPAPGLIEDTRGNLYGITTFGFPQIYKLPQRGAIQILHTFCTGECSDG